jgi:hypothetical protein
MTRLPDLPPGRFRLPAGTVVYHGSGLDCRDAVFARGLLPRKPAEGNWGSFQPSDPADHVAARQRQPSGVYVMREFAPARLWAASDAPCVWKIDAGGLLATRDPEYAHNPDFLVLVARVQPSRLLGMYDCSRETWVSV